MKAALIYNPSAGAQRHKRMARVEAAAAALRSAGIEPELLPTRAAGSAGEQAAEAIAAGHEMIFACGGDGTLHEVLQGMMSSPRHADVPLGFVPLGTGNVVASDLGLPRDAAEAVRTQLAAKPKRIAAGMVEFTRFGGVERDRRYFIAVCGIGPDAHMLQKVSSEKKARYGLFAYIAAGLETSITHAMPFFEAEYDGADSGERQSCQVSQIMAVRINNFGNFMRRFAPEAGLHRDDLQLVLFKTRSILRYNAFMAGRTSGFNWNVKGIELAHARELEARCIAGSAGDPILVEADGEVLGQLPARITTLPNAFTLMLPEKR
jgi:diacylglycerol kinase (ATP)